ncbi:MAG: carboxypeptidase regulatory-like domain-containing protein [Candidatus Brockarchaeota archaeon]|nr:carboxypeptidase regulatory-like domain-containing protein [Candidatus Brockarchaeota archaeon]
MLNKSILQAFHAGLLTSILLLSLTLTILFVKGEITITGKIIDVNGNPIERVEVEAYSDQSLVEKTHTSANGYFSISLASGAYELILEKDGYETRSITISPQSIGHRNLGNIILDYSLKFSVSQLKIRVKSMSEVGIQVTLRNKGSKDELVDIEVDAPSGWEAGMYSDSMQVWRLKLFPGETQSLTLILRIPFNASGEYLIKTRVIGSIVREEEISVQVDKEEPQIFIANQLSVQGLCGSSVNFELMVKNPLKKRLTSQISVSAPWEWEAIVLREDGKRLYDVSLDPGEYVKVVLKVSVPEDAQPGRYRVRIQASSQEFTSSQEFYVMVTKGVFNPKVYTGTPYVEAYAGSSASFPIEVENTGDSDGILSINVTQLPVGYSWKLSDPNGNILSKVYLKSNERKKLNLVIDVPPLEEPRTIPFLLEAHTAESSSRLGLTLGILGFYSMSYETRSFYMETTAGSESSFVIEIKNNGYSVLTSVKPILTSIPEKFRVEYTPELIPFLKPQERALFTLRIKTDADISAGDYFISFKVKSDQYSLPERDLRILIRQRIEIIVIGIAMIVILLILLYWIRRLYGRR